MCSLDRLFTSNRAWSAGRIAQDPEFFIRLARQQSPRYQWIGYRQNPPLEGVKKIGRRYGVKI